MTPIAIVDSCSVCILSQPTVRFDHLRSEDSITAASTFASVPRSCHLKLDDKAALATKLVLDEVSVDAVVAKELLVCAPLHNLAAVHYTDEICKNRQCRR